MINKEDKILVAYIKSRFHCKVQPIKGNYHETNYILLKSYGIGYDNDSWIPACNLLFKNIAEILDYLDVQNAEYSNTYARRDACKSYLTKHIRVN